MTTHLPPRADLNIGPDTAKKLTLIDSIDDGEVIAEALEVAVLALVDIAGADPQRPTIARPSKLAKRALDRLMDMLETEVERQPSS